MSYFDTTMHGWRYDNINSGTLPSFSADFTNNRTAVFDGTNLYVTWAVEGTSGVAADGAGETYKYSFNSSTNTFTYVSKVAFGGHHIVDDGTNIWVLNFVKVYKIVKNTMTVTPVTIRAWSGTNQQLQKSLFIAEGYLWAIEWNNAASGTGNQKLYKINMSTNAVTTYSPTWGIVDDRWLVGAGGKVWSNPVSILPPYIPFPTIDPSTGALSSTNITYGVQVPPPSSTSVVAMLPGTSSTFYVIDASVKTTYSSASWYSNSVYCYVVDTTVSTATSLGSFLSGENYGANGLGGPLVGINESTSSTSATNRIVANFAFDQATTTMICVRTASTDGPFPVLASFNLDPLKRDLVYGGGYKTPFYGDSKVALATNVAPIGGVTYATWQAVPANSVTLSNVVGGIGSAEYTLPSNAYGTHVSMCKYGQYIVTIGTGTGGATAGTTFTIHTLPTIPKQLAIRPHMLAVGCNVGLS